MKKVCMIEYQGRCDEDDNPIGHGPKVLTEYYDFIKEKTDVSLALPKVILANAPESLKKDVVMLDHKIVMKSGKSFFDKLNDKRHMFANIKKAIKHTDADDIWFFNVEYYLMLYLFLHRRPKKRIVCTFFLDGYHNGTVGKIKQWVFERAQKKIDLIISTGAGLRFKNCKYEYIPDYYYDESKYEIYRLREKEDKVVCLGTMNNGKKLEELVDAFSSNGYPLYIAGRFFDKDRYEALKRNAASNITIEDKYLSDEEYLSILSSAKYTILPYDKQQYSTQTSGVMQEAVFTDSVVVTYGDILKGNNTAGVEIDSLSCITVDRFTDEKKRKEILDIYRTQRTELYNKKHICDRYINIFS